ncbi:Hypothetical predicted protein [Mytilus galloprovincialis]|uniref:B box-type domain-containing protein n=1 Tax=Mytilus galloprovincialis TaxID=29158 RepID=A0A8B6FI81_MYTGA|nr:Hypothetical predicted protein [Mytilus galloprovincialis]
MADSTFCVGCQLRDEHIKAVSWCSDCSELVCKTCTRIHEQMYPPHKVVPMTEIQQLSTSILKLSKNCEKHSDQKNELYCCQHDKAICVSCVTLSHQNCKPIIPIKKAAKGVKGGTAISDLERRMDNLSQVMENIMRQNETTLEDLKKSRNNIKKKVSEIKQSVIAHLDKLEADTHKDIDDKYKQCYETTSQNKDNADSSSESLSTWKRDLKALKQHTSDINFFQVLKFLDVKTYEKELEIRDIQAVPTLTYHPPKTESTIKSNHPDLGTIDIENVPVIMPLLEIDQQCQFLVRGQRELSFTNSFECRKLSSYVSSMFRGCIIPGNRLLLSLFLGNNLFICELDGSNPKEIKLDYPAARVTLYDNNHVLLSLGNGSIEMINLKTLKPGKKIKVGGHCRGITSMKDRIWVRNHPNTLTKVDIKGKVKNTIHLRFDPFDICANKDGDVFCTNLTSDKVYAVSSDGKETEIYNRCDLISATGVAVDDRGYVYIAGRESNTIHKISNDGQEHDIVLTADDGIQNPTGLSYNFDTRELLVVNNYGCTVNIYKTQ